MGITSTTIESFSVPKKNEKVNCCVAELDSPTRRVGWRKLTAAVGVVKGGLTGKMVATLPETNIIAPANGWFEYDCFLFWPGLLSGAMLLLMLLLGKRPVQLDVHIYIYIHIILHYLFINVWFDICLFALNIYIYIFTSIPFCGQQIRLLDG